MLHERSLQKPEAISKEPEKLCPPSYLADSNCSEDIVVPHMCFPTIVRKQDIEAVRELNSKD
jgi:hypothetical protein